RRGERLLQRRHVAVTGELAHGGVDRTLPTLRAGRTVRAGRYGRTALPVRDRRLLVRRVVRRDRVGTGRDGALLGVERLLAGGAADGLQPALGAVRVLGALRQHERVGEPLVGGAVAGERGVAVVLEALGVEVRCLPVTHELEAGLALHDELLGVGPVERVPVLIGVAEQLLVVVDRLGDVRTGPARLAGPQAVELVRAQVAD